MIAMLEYTDNIVKPLVDGLITTTKSATTRSFECFSSAAVDLSCSTLNYVAGIIRWHL